MDPTKQTGFEPRFSWLTVHDSDIEAYAVESYVSVYFSGLL